MHDDKYGDNIGYIRFSITSSLDYETIAFFYNITGAVPYMVEEHPGDDCVMHLVRLRSLPSLLPMDSASVPQYTVEYQTDSFEWGISRLVIRDSDERAVVRYERDSSGWSSFAFEKPRLKYYTD